MTTKNHTAPSVPMAYDAESYLAGFAKGREVTPISQNRREEIEAEANKRIEPIDLGPSLGKAWLRDDIAETKVESFIEGAEWSDANPSDSSRGSEGEFDEWSKTNLDFHPADYAVARRAWNAALRSRPTIPRNGVMMTRETVEEVIDAIETRQNYCLENGIDDYSRDGVTFNRLKRALALLRAELKL